MVKPKIALALTLLAALANAPLAADWLVTRDGGRFETQGKWRVEGAKVLFTLPNGTMGVLRKSEVDLDASASASAAASNPQPKAVDGAQKKPAREPVLTLTNKDIPKASPAAGSGETSAAPAAAGVSSPSSPQKALVVVRTWRQNPGKDGGIELSGLVKNVGSDVAVNITLQIEVRDGEGNVHKAAGFLEQTSLVRNDEALFRAVLPDVTQIAAEPNFVVTAEGATMGLEPEKPKEPAPTPKKPG